MKTDRQKIKILYYSDCPSFLGCENMLISFFNSPSMHQNFDIYFAYRHSQQYKEELHSRLKLKIIEKPLNLPTLNFLFDRINRFKNGLLKKFLKVIVVSTFLQYWFFFYDIIILFFNFRKIKPDILHINNGGYPGAYSCLAAVFAAKLARVKKIIFIVNNIVVPYNSFSRYLDKPIDRFIKRNTTIFVTGSKNAGKMLRNLWDLPERKVINIPNTIIPRLIFEPKESVLKRLGVTNNHIILGNIAILERRKGQKHLIEALAILKEKFSNFKNIILIIEGIGSQKEYLKRLVAHLNLRSSILFLENEKNIFDIINILDIFILSSIEYEDFPNVILEAMSLGKPVIGTRLAGMPEQIDDGINGFIVNPRDAQSLSEAILMLVQDKEKRTEMGLRSLERFNGLFSCEKVIDKYTNLYTDVLGYN